MNRWGLVSTVALCLALPFGGAALAQEATAVGTGAVLRGLDKLTGQVSDIELTPGGLTKFGHIEIVLEDCRYPDGNPSGDAYAFLTVRDVNEEDQVYSGWMVASAPALNPMEHKRYDVWPLRCTTS